MSYGCHNKNVCDKYKKAAIGLENPCKNCLKSLEEWNDNKRDNEDYYYDNDFKNQRRW